MSEAILYAMDAPRAKSADAAADFVEKWQDSKKAVSYTHLTLPTTPYV